MRSFCSIGSANCLGGSPSKKVISHHRTLLDLSIEERFSWIVARRSARGLRSAVSARLAYHAEPITSHSSAHGEAIKRQTPGRHLIDNLPVDLSCRRQPTQEIFLSDSLRIISVPTSHGCKKVPSVGEPRRAQSPGCGGENESAQMFYQRLGSWHILRTPWADRFPRPASGVSKTVI